MIDNSDRERITNPTPFADAVSAPTFSLPDTVEEDLPPLPDPLPVMQAWWCLVQPWTPPTQTKSGLVLAQVTKDMMKYNQYVAKIVAMGPFAFKHPRLNPDGTFKQVPKIGDWVFMARLQGQRFEYQDPDDSAAPVVELRICADDAILAVMPTPRGWKIGGVS